MVKGISKQVIVVHAPEPKLFEEAIFILREDAVGSEGVTDELLLKEAKRLIGAGANKKRFRFSGLLWMLAGIVLTGLIWFGTILL
jgi:hypothetical protein